MNSCVHTVYIHIHNHMYKSLIQFIDSPVICCRTCQEKHWTSVHKVKCKSQSQPPTVGVPFIVSLPKSQCTYRKLADVAEKFARSVCIYSFTIVYNNGTHTIKSIPL